MNCTGEPGCKCEQCRYDYPQCERDDRDLIDATPSDNRTYEEINKGG
jgi:hypothetical protein